MNQKHSKAIVLDDLITLHINNINRVLDLKWIGRKEKSLQLIWQNPVTGEKEVRGTIHLTANIDTGAGNDYITITGTVGTVLVNQTIYLRVKKSSIRNGHWYFFNCPVTGNSCRTLYLHQSKFVGKAAIDNPHFKSQTLSRKQRKANQQIRQVTKLQKALNAGRKKWFKKYHAGEPTVKYIKSVIANERLHSEW